ncbi:type II toxin-antitoxin system RelE/ParE family toxin [Variovorax sp. J22G73]|uniref:type II toxin-antitoxin system RelE/ParE family toxin n=1 Tax=unclassified Variovorax TaxID=663243 RepID=UPI000D5E4643|nr:MULTISPECIES: type II toxin-antitoxin system RelE/ParE family toxin [unclassified Variovorax]MDM0007809.1 type II toxin-antitoxin system RelE/ParE family toxin [Variovorax sp. J22R203]MDM0100568.1 type II toxin-antitoxin system RelE/ParE family toxin [Variovorax sp. J22G73]
MSYAIRFTRQAAEDLERRYDFVLERELDRNGDLALASRALEAIEHGISALAFSPFTCRKAGDSPFIRELVIPFGASGYVALFEIEASDSIVVAAVRHQREDDYH